MWCVWRVVCGVRCVCVGGGRGERERGGGGVCGKGEWEYRAIKIPTHRVRALQLRNLAIFCTLNHQAHVVAHIRHVNDLVQARMRRLQLWDLHCLLTDCTRGTAEPAHRDVDHLINGLQLGNHNGKGLRECHDRDVNDLGERNCGTSTAFCTV